MKKNITKHSILKALSFIPALLIMSMIFSFSSQDSGESSSLSEPVASYIIDLIDKLLNLDLTELQSTNAIEQIHTFIRKVGHFGEYLLLGVSLSLPLYTLYGIRGRRLFFSTLCFCIIFASSDEIHQLFVDGRSGSPKDVLIDSFGAFTGIASTQILCCIIRKCIFDTLHMHSNSASNCTH